MKKKLRLLRRNIYKFVLYFCSLIPYKSGSKLLSLVYTNGTLRHLLYRRTTYCLQKVLQEIESHQDRERAMRRHCACASFMPWRVNSLARCSDTQLSQWLVIKNLDLVNQHVASPSGLIILNSHFVPGRVVPLALTRSRIEVYSLETDDPFLLRRLNANREYLHVVKMPHYGRDGTHNFWLKQVWKMQRVLRFGGTVHMVGDGLQGKSCAEYTFYGRRRPFQTSFAELAARTNAAVIPVLATMDENGTMDVEFDKPFDKGRHIEPVSERVDFLLRQYVKWLESKWKADPGNIVPNHLRYFLSLQMAEQNINIP